MTTATKSLSRKLSVRRGELSSIQYQMGFVAGWTVWEDGRIIADGFDTRTAAREWVSAHA